MKIWRVKPGIKFEKIEKGLHQNQYPSTIKNIIRNDEVGVLHFGFADELNLSYKYLIYKKNGRKYCEFNDKTDVKLPIDIIMELIDIMIQND